MFIICSGIEDVRTDQQFRILAADFIKQSINGQNKYSQRHPQIKELSLRFTIKLQSIQLIS